HHVEPAALVERTVPARSRDPVEREPVQRRLHDGVDNLAVVHAQLLPGPPRVVASGLVEAVGDRGSDAPRLLYRQRSLLSARPWVLSRWFEPLRQQAVDETGQVQDRTPGGLGPALQRAGVRHDVADALCPVTLDGALHLLRPTDLTQGVRRLELLEQLLLVDLAGHPLRQA